MKLTTLLEDLEYICCQGTENVEVTDVVYDSRKVQPGSLFVCVRGAVVDGCLCIHYNGAMTNSIPPQISATCIHRTQGTFL